MDITKFARELAEKFHYGQVRKCVKTAQVKFKGHGTSSSGMSIPVEGIETPEPYVSHPIRVAGSVYQFFVRESNKTKPSGKQYSSLSEPFYYEHVESSVYIATAFLHDVLEDCANVSENDLIRLFYKELSSTHYIGPVEQQMKIISDWHNVVRSVKFLTKTKGQNFSYVNYLMEIRKDPVAKLVKLADLQDNMSDLERGSSLYQKYELTKFVLMHPYEPEANRK